MPKSQFAGFVFTPERKREFLDLYAQGKSVKACAREIGISHVTVFYHKRTDPEFAREFEVAMETNTDILEDHLYEMATEKGIPGNVAAVFGMLKARRPTVWRENLKIEHGGSIQTTTSDQLAAARERARLGKAGDLTH